MLAPPGVSPPSRDLPPLPVSTQPQAPGEAQEKPDLAGPVKTPLPALPVAEQDGSRQAAPRPRAATGKALDTAEWQCPWSPSRWVGLEAAFREMEGLREKHQSVVSAAGGAVTDLASAVRMVQRLREGPYAALAKEAQELISLCNNLNSEAAGALPPDKISAIRIRAKRVEADLVARLKSSMEDLGGSMDSTLQGRTFLCDFEYSVDQGDRVARERGAVLVVAPEGVWLQEQMDIICMHGADQVKDDPDLVMYRIESKPMRLSEVQRSRWGAAASIAGRVYWVWQPPQPVQAEGDGGETGETKPKRGRGRPAGGGKTKPSEVEMIRPKLKVGRLAM